MRARDGGGAPRGAGLSVKGEADGWLIVKTLRFAVERKRPSGSCSIRWPWPARRNAPCCRRVPAGMTHFQATTRNRMCGSVGGDFYDFIRLNEQQVAVL